MFVLLSLWVSSFVLSFFHHNMESFVLEISLVNCIPFTVVLLTCPNQIEVSFECFMDGWVCVCVCVHACLACVNCRKWACPVYKK